VLGQHRSRTASRQDSEAPERHEGQSLTRLPLVTESDADKSAPIPALDQRTADRRFPTACQISSAITAPMIEPMMPDGWKKPSSPSLWKSR
jgi:hypothetical protein